MYYTPPHVLEGERSTSEVAKGVLLATVKNMSKRGIVHTGAEVYKVHYRVFFPNLSKS